MIRLNSTHYFIMTIPKKREPQQIAFHHSSGIDFKEFINLLQNHILFQLMMLLLHQILFYALERIFQKGYKN